MIYTWGQWSILHIFFFARIESSNLQGYENIFADSFMSVVKLPVAKLNSFSRSQYFNSRGVLEGRLHFSHSFEIANLMRPCSSQSKWPTRIRLQRFKTKDVDKYIPSTRWTKTSFICNTVWNKTNVIPCDLTVLWYISTVVCRQNPLTSLLTPQMCRMENSRT